MSTHLSKYFCITAFQSSPNQETIDHLIGNYTDRSHSMFLPPTKITRKQAMEMINEGIILFVETEKIKQSILKIVKLEKMEYLRLDGKNITRDEIGLTTSDELTK